MWVSKRGGVPLASGETASQAEASPYRLPFPRDPNGFVDWTFSTVRCWGEEAQGRYQLVIHDIGESSSPALQAAAVALAPKPSSAHLTFLRSPEKRPGGYKTAGGGECPWSQPVACCAWQPLSFPGDEALRPGVLQQWQLALYGSSWSLAEIKERQR